MTFDGIPAHVWLAALLLTLAALRIVWTSDQNPDNK